MTTGSCCEDGAKPCSRIGLKLTEQSGAKFDEFLRQTSQVCIPGVSTSVNWTALSFSRDLSVLGAPYLLVNRLGISLEGVSQWIGDTNRAWLAKAQAKDLWHLVSSP